MSIFTMLLSIANFTTSTASGTYQSLIVTHGYLAIIALMALESASLPIPSEIILPITGVYVHDGTFSLYVALLASLIGTTIGITIDYYVAYFLGKDVIYKHSNKFHIKKERIMHFDSWFNQNAAFTVFAARLIPIVRGLISFPAGFAQMDLKRFYFYSLFGAIIWNAALIMFGYYALSTNNIVITFAAVGIFAVILYAIYHLYQKRESKTHGRLDA